MKTIVLVDIDGTVADIRHRLHFIENKPKNWKGFFDEVLDDKPIEEIIDVILTLSTKYEIVFCTGRKEATRAKTEDWIKRYFGEEFKFTLLMRKNNDFRSDVITKPEILLNSGIKPEEVVIAFEDRTVVVEKWREMGIKVAQVERGDF